MISQPNNSFVKKIISDLNTKIIGKNYYHFKSINSTNLFAKELIKKGVEEGVVVVTDVQTSGRGRKDRKWSSPKGGLWFSVVLYPTLSSQQGMLITMTSSLAVAQSIKVITGITPEIKWPNDLIINGRKVCGILTEIDTENSRINYSIVGIGINVNNKLDEGLKKIATSLLNEVGSRVSRVKLLRYILKSFDENYIRLISGDYDFIRALWHSYSNIIGKQIQVKENKTILTGKVTEIDSNGCIILNTDSGIIRIISGDIEYL